MKRFSSDAIQPHEIEHAKFVRENAAECTLFLKRGADFPVSPCSINLYGSGARRTVKGGKGSGDVNTRNTVSVEQGLINAGFSVETREWLSTYDRLVQQSEKDFWEELQAEAKKLNTSPYIFLMSRQRPAIEYNLALGGTGEVNVYVIARDSSEGMDRREEAGDYFLLNCEVRDIRLLSKRKEKFLLVLNVGGVIDLSPVIDEVKNILLLGQLGAETGNVFADILMGKSVPSGKLTTTWAEKLSDYPSTAYFGMPTEVEYHEGVYVGYRYFDTFGVRPRFAFGFGLGYTDFEFVPERFDVSANRIEVTVSVTNIGDFSGKEVLQVYYSKDEDTDAPRLQLIGFAKTETLKPKQTQMLLLSFDILSAAAYDGPRSAFVLKKGSYRIHIGNSSDHTVCACAVAVRSDVVAQNVCRLRGEPIPELQRERLPFDFPPPILGKKEISPVPPLKVESAPYRSPRVQAMTDEQLVRLTVGVLNDLTLDNNIGNSGKKVAGAAGETYSQADIAPLVLADGPAGLRLSPTYKLDVNGNVMASESALAGMLPGGVQKIEADENTFYQYCTSLPVATALAQTFNEALCRQMGDLVGKEMQLFGVDIWLAPALNIHRNPLCGRNFEYYSEDPFVSGTIAAAIVRGVQQNEGCSVTVKHFCCNNQETDRSFSNSVLSERTLREIYLKGFAICIAKSGPKALMTSYNLVNGTHTANSTELLVKVLREEWNYEGLVMTDWLSTGGMGTGEKYGPATARGCIAASNDLIMPGRDEDLYDILQGLKSGEVTRGKLEESANRVLKLADGKRLSTAIK